MLLPESHLLPKLYVNKVYCKKRKVPRAANPLPQIKVVTMKRYGGSEGSDRTFLWGQYFAGARAPADYLTLLSITAQG